MGSDKSYKYPRVPAATPTRRHSAPIGVSGIRLVIIFLSLFLDSTEFITAFGKTITLQREQHQPEAWWGCCPRPGAYQRVADPEIVWQGLGMQG